MKKIISTYLILLAILVVVQPTLAMHLCGNEISTMITFTKQQQSDHCGCNSTKTNNRLKDNTLQLTKKGCCESQEYQTKISDYQVTDHTSIPAKLVYTYNAMWLPFSFLLSNFDIHGIENTNRTYFSSSGVFNSTDILTSHCILQI